jgi:hypothetical protein
MKVDASHAWLPDAAPVHFHRCDHASLRARRVCRALVGLERRRQVAYRERKKIDLHGRNCYGAISPLAFSAAHRLRR